MKINPQILPITIKAKKKTIFCSWKFISLVLDDLLGAKPRLGMKNAATAIAIMIKILKNHNLIETNQCKYTRSPVCSTYPFCIPLRGSVDRLTHSIKSIIIKKKQANAN